MIIYPPVYDSPNRRHWRRPIVRHRGPRAPAWYRPRALLATLLLAAGLAPAQSALHLLGFVEEPCAGEAHCFVLRVKPDANALAGERITVRFSQDTKIFDPENYELTLAQQNIVAGSHLRLLISADPERGADAYRASFIWIGD